MCRCTKTMQTCIRTILAPIVIAVSTESILAVPNSGVPQKSQHTPRSAKTKGYITFVINTHDFVHVSQSADILLQLIGLFEEHGVRGDFYLTAPITRHYAESRPDVIRRLRDSKMMISYHVRPPHILYPGFNGRLRDLGDDALAKTLRDYETYRLDMTTGELLRDQPGGYQYVAATFGRKPVALGVPTSSPRERSGARRVYRELGAKVIVEHHESGTKLDRPFEWVDGLLMRPGDFSVTRWAAPGDRPGRRGLGNFWWNWETAPGGGGEDDPYWTPMNKPAEDIMTSYYWTPAGDFDDDRDVDMFDISFLAGCWLDSGVVGDPDLNNDGDVNMSDFSLLADNWLLRMSL